MYQKKKTIFLSRLSKLRSLEVFVAFFSCLSHRPPYFLLQFAVLPMRSEEEIRLCTWKFTFTSRLVAYILSCMSRLLLSYHWFILFSIHPGLFATLCFKRNNFKANLEYSWLTLPFESRTIIDFIFIFFNSQFLEASNQTVFRNTTCTEKSMEPQL